MNFFKSFIKHSIFTAIILLQIVTCEAALSQAIKHRKNKDIKRLIQKNHTIIQKADELGNSPLALATIYGNTPIVTLLLNTCVNINHRSATNGETALTLAAGHGMLQITDLLLKANADVNYSTHNGNTALTLTAARGNIEIMNCLIKAAAQIDRANNNGYTPLMQATYLGQASAVKLLLESKANTHLRNNNGQTALDIAHQRLNNIIDGHRQESLTVALRKNITEIAHTLQEQQSIKFSEEIKHDQAEDFLCISDNITEDWVVLDSLPASHT